MQIFQEFGVNGSTLSLFDEADLSTVPITQEESETLISAIKECKMKEYHEKRRKYAVRYVEEWKRENDEGENELE